MFMAYGFWGWVELFSMYTLMGLVYNPYVLWSHYANEGTIIFLLSIIAMPLTMIWWPGTILFNLCAEMPNPVGAYIGALLGTMVGSIILFKYSSRLAYKISPELSKYMFVVDKILLILLLAAEAASLATRNRR